MHSVVHVQEIWLQNISQTDLDPLLDLQAGGKRHAAPGSELPRAKRPSAASNTAVDSDDEICVDVGASDISVDAACPKEDAT